jgi:hypothetical protein
MWSVYRDVNAVLQEDLALNPDSIPVWLVYTNLNGTRVVNPLGLLCQAAKGVPVIENWVVLAHLEHMPHNFQ